MLTLYSPAKVNLFLRVLRKRSDGYHELAALFQAISLYDTLQITLSDRDELTCTDGSLPIDSSNLIIKAAQLFRHKTGLRFHFKAHLEKRIPTMAGLGGGSSNAATTLWALNKLLQTNIPIKELALWSSEIGSDIPFFFSTGSAYCTGRGEIVYPLPPLRQKELLIIKPPFGLSTPAVYKHLDLSRLLPRDPEFILNEFLKGREEYFNDLELPAFALNPALAQLKTQLENMGLKNVLMSGSGSAFFCHGIVNPLSQVYQQRAHFTFRKTDSWYE